MENSQENGSRRETPVEGNESRASRTPLPSSISPPVISMSHTPHPQVTRDMLANLMESVSVIRGDLLNLRLGVQAHVAENELWVLKMMRMTKKALSAGLRRRSSATKKAAEVKPDPVAPSHEETTDEDITNQIGSLLRASEHLSPPPGVPPTNDSSMRTCSSTTPSPLNETNAPCTVVIGQIDMPSVTTNQMDDEASAPLAVRGLISQPLTTSFPQTQQRAVALQQFDDHIRRLEENVVANAVNLRKKFEDSQDALRKMRPAGSTPQHTLKSAPPRSTLSSAASERQATLSIAYYGGVNTMPNQQHSWAMPPTIIPTATKITLPAVCSARMNDRAAVEIMTSATTESGAAVDSAIPLPQGEWTAATVKTVPPKRKVPQRLGDTKPCTFEDSLFGHQVQVQVGRAKCNPAEAARDPSPPNSAAINVPTTTHSSEDFLTVRKSQSPRPQRVFNGRVVKVPSVNDRSAPPEEIVPRKPEVQKSQRLVVRSQRKPITAKASQQEGPSV